MKSTKKVLYVLSSALLALGVGATLSSCGDNNSLSSVTNSSVAPVVEKYLKIVSTPTKTSYTIGEYLDYFGLVVKKYVSTDGVEDGGTTMSLENLSFSLAEGKVFSEEDISDNIQITISDPSDDKVRSVSFPIAVHDRQKYAVYFENYDGTLLSTQSAKENQTGISYAGEESLLVHPKDDTYLYHFIGWYVKGDAKKTLIDLSAYVVTGEVTFVAAYKAYEASSSDGTFRYAYMEEENGYAVIGYTDEMQKTVDAADDGSIDLVIPQTFLDAPVIAIANAAFKYCSAIKTLTLPEGLRMIGEEAFVNCTGLTAIELPASLTTLSRRSFSSCTNVTSVVFKTYEDGEKKGTADLRTIPSEAFNGLTKVTTLTLAEGIETLEFNAFTGFAISSLVIPDSVTTLGHSFSSDGKISDIVVSTMKNLQSITLGASLTADVVAQSGLNKIETLTEYKVSEKSTELIAVDGVLYSKDMTRLLGYPASKADYNDEGIQTEESKTFTIPDTVITIEPYAFGSDSSHKFLNSIVFGANVKTVELQGFYQRQDCLFTFNDKLETIGNYAFYSVTEGTAATGELVPGSTTLAAYAFVMPDSVTTIGDYAFGNNRQLVSFTFGSNMANFGANLFYSCLKLTDITVKEGANLSVSEDNAFIYNKDQTKVLWYNSSKAVTSYVMPSTVTEVAPYLLQGNTKITELTLSPNLQVIGDYAFKGMSKVTSVLTLGDSLREVGASAFSGMSSVAGINIPDSLEKIGDNAFSSLSKAVIQNPDGAITIGADCVVGEKAFYGLAIQKVTYLASALSVSEFASCTKLTEVTLSDAITLLPESVFSGCTALASINIPTHLQKIDKYAFKGTKSLVSDFVLPEGVTTLADNALANTSFASIQVPTSVTEFGSNVFNNALATSITLQNNFADGVLPNSTFYGCKNMTTFSLPQSVTAIGESAFYNCSTLTEVTLSNDIASLGKSAFAGCTKMTSFSAPGVKAIGTSVFSGDTVLSSVTLSDDMEALTSMAFYNCAALESFSLPSALKTIGIGAFQGSGLTSFVMPEGSSLEINANGVPASSVFQNCKKLTSVTLNSTVTVISNSMFNGCSALTSVTGYGTLVEISNSAFNGASLLESAPVMTAVKTIGSSAFKGCAALKEVALPETADFTEIAASTFSGCTSLTSIVLPSQVETVGSTAFEKDTSLAEVTILNPEIEFNSTRYRSGVFANSGVTKVNFAGTKEQAEALFTYNKTGLTKNKVITINYGYDTESAGTEQWTIA